VDSKTFLKLDVPTRWNYTYLMLKAAIVYEKVFLKLSEDDTNYVIDLSEAKDGFGHLMKMIGTMPSISMILLCASLLVSMLPQALSFIRLEKCRVKMAD
jgi:hypothetical protein